MGLNGENIQNYISIGESLEKIKGSDIIIVYGKDSLNNWIPKELNKTGANKKLKIINKALY